MNMGPRCPGCGAYGDLPGLCDECRIKANSRPEYIRWYCHTCRRTHTHTTAERDAHRDEIRATEHEVLVSRRTHMERSAVHTHSEGNEPFPGCPACATSANDDSAPGGDR